MLYVDQGLWERDPPPPSGAPHRATPRGCPGRPGFARYSWRGRPERGSGKARRRPWRPGPSRCRGRSLGARSPSRSLTRGAADFRGKPEIVICPLVLTDLSWYSLTTIFQDPPMRLKREAVEALMAEKPAGTTLEEALEVFEVFASGTLVDEVYVLDDVSGKRIAIAPAALRTKYRKE